jgi:CRISP-associated protein Cas1
MASKFENCISTLENIVLDNEYRELAILRHKKRISEIRNPRKSYTLSKILGVEGDCAQSYFRAWRGIPLNWAGSKRIPIPDNWAEFSTRNMVWRTRQSLARHPLNALLNYAYGMAVAQMRSQVIAAGLDPCAGVLHSRDRNQIPLIYDLLEPVRPLADRAVLKFVAANSFQRGDFTINSSGGCRLNPQLVTALVSNLKFLGDECQKYVGAFIARLAP